MEHSPEGRKQGSTQEVRVGFLGLGRMGSLMAANVAKAGFPLAVFNRTRHRAESLAAEWDGIVVGEAPADVARRVDVLVTMLADGPAVREVYEGPGGVLDGMRPGTVAVEMSTISPEDVRRLARRIQKGGGDLVDAPVSGSLSFAEAGELTIMAGGDRPTVDRVRPVLEAVGRPVFHVGPTGAGATMKLAVNTVVYGLNQAVAEALVLAERAGVDRTTAYEVFAQSAASAPFVHYRREAFERPGQVPPALEVTLAEKDLRLILELGERVGAHLPQSVTNLNVLQSTSAAGYEKDDVSAVARYLRAQGRGPPPGQLEGAVPGDATNHQRSVDPLIHRHEGSVDE